MMLFIIEMNFQLKINHTKKVKILYNCMYLKTPLLILQYV